MLLVWRVMSGWQFRSTIEIWRKTKPSATAIRIKPIQIECYSWQTNRNVIVSIVDRTSEKASISKPSFDRESYKLSWRKVTRGLKFEMSTSFRYLHNCVIGFLIFGSYHFFVTFWFPFRFSVLPFIRSCNTRSSTSIFFLIYTWGIKKDKLLKLSLALNYVTFSY